jgi:GDP-L-fucose synthase
MQSPARLWAAGDTMSGRQMPEYAVDWTTHRVLVTGGAGFLGRVVCSGLKSRGVTEDRLYVPLHSEYDLTRNEAVERLYAEARPDIVIHLAAEVGGIGANRASPGRFFYANLAMGLHMIEQARLCGVQKCVQIGTICAYPKITPVPFREPDLWSGYPEETNAPYGIAKKALLVMCQAYRQQYGLNAIYLLPVNLYGPGDDCEVESSHVIPALIRKCMEAKRSGARRIVCWGDGTPTREFLFVGDAAEAILLATERYDDPEPVNIGSGNEIAIRELAAIIARLAGFTGDIEWDASMPNGQPRRCLDTSRARARFGFVARTDLITGLRATIEWYQREKA